MRKISVAAVRQKNGLSQKELAEMLGVSQASISRMEIAGYFSKKCVDKVCELFNIPKDEEIVDDLKDILTAIKSNGYIVKFNKDQIDDLIEKYERLL